MSRRSVTRVGMSLLVAGLAWATPATAVAGVAVSDLFDDHMVFQRDAAVRVWGHDDAGRPVTVRMQGPATAAAGVVTAGDGEWSVQLPPMPAGGPYTLDVSDGGGGIRLSDVLVGDVWVAAGQSNMAFRMAPQPPWTLGVLDYPAELAAATDPRVRFYTAVGESYLAPERVSHGLWEACTPAAARDVSAVAYYFARRVSREGDVPVGMLVTAVGATSIRSWMDGDALAAVEGRGALDAAAAKLAAAGGDGRYRASMVAYRAGVRRSLPVDGPLPPFEEPYAGHQFQPTGFYNGMVAPLQRFPVKGVIWYQGEADAERPGAYPALFGQLAAQWRRQWGRPDLPIYFVQLPNFDPAKVDDARADALREGWTIMREAQARCLRVAHTGMAVTADVGAADLIHPRDKRTVGERLARLALAGTYGRPVVASGPVLGSVRRRGERLVLSFSPGGLVAKGPLGGFELASRDGRFHPAAAIIDGDTVVVTAAAVPVPTAARYGWSATPTLTLYNTAGLPASPFRTEGLSEGRP